MCCTASGSRSSRRSSWPSTSGGSGKTAASPDPSSGTAQSMAVVNTLRGLVNFLSAPQYLVTVALVLLVVAINVPAIWSKKGGIFLGIAAVLFFALSYLDPNFNAVATLPDNVPIVGMIFLVGFFFWWAMHNAYENDRRIAEGKPTIEGEDSAQKVFSWPDLVYVELICLVVVMAVMIVWRVVLKGPSET